MLNKLGDPARLARISLRLSPKNGLDRTTLAGGGLNDTTSATTSPG